MTTPGWVVDPAARSPGAAELVVSVVTGIKTGVAIHIEEGGQKLGVWFESPAAVDHVIGLLAQVRAEVWPTERTE